MLRHSNAQIPRLSRDTLSFIERAARQRKPDWLERNRAEYLETVVSPLQHLAASLKKRLATAAPGYHFPQRGLGRLKRSAQGAAEYGSPFRDYVSYRASRPSESRFDSNPSLFLMIHPGDEDGDEVLIAGGMYMPSSRQLRSIREAIALDATPFDRLFATKDFAASFPHGFSDERVATRPPRGFDPAHPRMDWLKYQGFFVWKSYRPREYGSADFIEHLVRDYTQVLRLNTLLDHAIQNRWPPVEIPGLRRAGHTKTVGKSGTLTHLEDIEAPKRKMDF